MAISKPKIKAMLICDYIITEQGTNKNSLIGVFENINSKRFPCTHPRLGVYINFTDAIGKYGFKIELIDIEVSKIIAMAEPPAIEYNDKLASNNLVFVFDGLKFEHSGKYEFRCFANGEICESKTFNLKQI